MNKMNDVDENPDTTGEERSGTLQKEVPTSIVAKVFDEKVRNSINPSPEKGSQEEQKQPSSQELTTTLNSARSAAPPVENVFALFAEAVSQRKKDSFTTFRQWEESCSTKISRHRSICETIIKAVYDKTKTSIEGINTVIKFFQERQKQEETYYTSMIDKLPSLAPVFLDKNLIDSGNWTLPSALKKCEQFHHQHCQNSQTISSFIESTILHDLLGELQKDFIKKLQVQQDYVNEARKKVNLANGKIAKKTQKYGNLFTELIVTANPAAQKRSKQKDLHNKELSIVSSSYAQVHAHRSLGSAVLALVNEAKKLELTRYDGIKQAFLVYMSKMTEIYGPTALGTETSALLDYFKVEPEVSALFSLNVMLTPEEVVHLKANSTNSDEPVTNEIIANHLEHLDQQVPQMKPLVLKEWSVLKESGIIKSFKPYKLVITVDDNILLIDTTDGKEFKKADQTIKLEQTAWLDAEGNKKKNPLVVEIEETKPGFLMNSKNKYVFKFNSEDDVDEFYHYINEYKKENPPSK